MSPVETPAFPKGFEDLAEDAIAFAAVQVKRLVTTQPDVFPIFTVNGRWHVEDEAWTNWTEGFLGGLIWIIARRTGDTWWREQAEQYSLLIEPRKDDRTVHDLGFLFISTWKRWFEATGDPAKWDTVVHAGRTMSMRFNEKGRYLRSFVSADSCFIDIMMNVGIIFEAARATGDKDLLRIATEHCLTTRRHLVRGDGSTAHEAIFDLDTGEFLRNGTHQGWRADSSWARGQAWALYGFGTAHALSGDARFLDTAERCADFFLDQTGDAIVPPNDWEEPEPPRPYESSAAAIAASGLWQLADLTADPGRAARYRDATIAILATLSTPEFLAVDEPGWEGILRHGVYHERRGLGVDESVMWGDYFFVEALDRVLESTAGWPPMIDVSGPTITTDIAIIGSGMGGGTLAYAIRNRGAKVLILERGGYLPREPENWSPREIFVAKRYRTTDPYLDGSGKPFQPSIYHVVGGCTKVYGAALPRFRREDFGVLESEDGVSPAWPIGYDELEPYYAEAERLFRVHGTAGTDPIEGARSTPFPYPAVPHEPVIAEIADSFEKQGLRPFPLPLGIDLREGGTCIRCKTCDGFPCQILAKSDAEVCVTTPALESPNVSMLTGARALALRTDPTGRRVTALEIEVDGNRRTVIASTFVIAAGAINSAALLLRSASDRHPDGLANSTGLVGRNYMAHLNSALIAVRPNVNGTVFQKTLALNDWYFGESRARVGMGHAQLLGKLQAEMLQGSVPWAPRKVLAEVANRSVDWYLMTEDLPDPKNRVSLDSSDRVIVNFQANNEGSHKRLVRSMASAMRRAGYPLIQTRRFPLDATAHQCGTAKFGDDPATSVLDPLCRSHDVANLFVMDASFLPSSSAQNPALTIAAQALRVGEQAAFN